MTTTTAGLDHLGVGATDPAAISSFNWSGTRPRMSYARKQLIAFTICLPSTPGSGKISSRNWSPRQNWDTAAIRNGALNFEAITQPRLAWICNASVNWISPFAPGGFHE